MNDTCGGAVSWDSWQGMTDREQHIVYYGAIKYVEKKNRLIQERE